MSQKKTQMISSISIIFILCLILFFLNSSLLAQIIYSGPAFGQISGGSLVSTGQFENIPYLPSSGKERKIMNAFWEKHDPQLTPDSYNNTPAAGPVGSNEFIDPGTLLTPDFASLPPSVILDFEGNLETNSIPPDPIMAAGPNHIITMVNSNFIIWDKNGNRLFQRGADSWFSNVLPYPGLFDPVIVYDHFAERWVMGYDLQDDVNQTGYWLISVSDDSDPMGTWCNFSFPAHLNGSTNAFNWGDYPKLGYDHQAVYISGRQFGFGGGFYYCKLRIIPKSQLYDLTCPPVDYTDFWNFRDPNNPGVVVDGPPLAAVHLDSTNTAHFVVDADYFTSTFITHWKITNPLSANPIVSAANIPTASSYPPPNGNQLGGGSPWLDSGRRAYRNAVLKDGEIWTSCPVAGGTSNQYAFARYVRFNANTSTLIEDVAFGANNYYLLYPAAMVDQDKNLFVVFTRSGTTEYAGAAFAGRKLGDPPGMSPISLLKEGEANYVKTFGGSRNRWGDYMGIALDPLYPNVVWGFIEYAKSPSSTWGTWVGAFTYSFYAAAGEVKDALNSNPIEFFDINTIDPIFGGLTSSPGLYTLVSPTQNVQFTASAFAYQDTTLTLSLTLNDTDNVDILMQPEIQATISGQVTNLGTGVEADLEFWAEGNPYPGAYATISTDVNGNYSLNTIIGNYDIYVFPKTPFAFKIIEDVALPSSGLNLPIDVELANLMLVDDDRGSEYETYYMQAFDSLSLKYNIWNVENNGSPTTADMGQIPSKVIVWFTGDSSSAPLNQTAQDEILNHLNNSGRLFITGQDIAETIDGSTLLNALGLNFSQNSTLTLVRGVNDDIGAGLIFILNSAGGANNQTSQDQLAISDTVTTRTIFHYGGVQTATAGAAYDNYPARAIFFGFGWEAINDPEKRLDLMDRMLQYLDVLSDIEDEISAQIPDKFDLSQNYPNPFNPSTTIRFSIPQASKVKIVVYNTLGQKVRELIDGNYTAGVHKILWNSLDDNGKPVSSGLYFYKMFTDNGYSNVRKLLLIK